MDMYIYIYLSIVCIYTNDMKGEFHSKNGGKANHMDIVRPPGSTRAQYPTGFENFFHQYVHPAHLPCGENSEVLSQP